MCVYLSRDIPLYQAILAASENDRRSIDVVAVVFWDFQADAVAFPGRNVGIPVARAHLIRVIYPPLCVVGIGEALA